MQVWSEKNVNIFRFYTILRSPDWLYSFYLRKEGRTIYKAGE